MRRFYKDFFQELPREEVRYAMIAGTLFVVIHVAIAAIAFLHAP